MALKKNRLAVAFLALFSITILAACATSAATPTSTPAPTATATPEPVKAITIDPRTDADGFLAALPPSEVDCASIAVGGEDALTKLVSFSDDALQDVSDVQLKVLASCISSDTVRKVVIGQLEIETGGLSDETAACVANHTDGIDFATLFSGQAVEQETLVSTMQALFCLSPEERRSLETSDQEILEITDLGGIDALECAVDGAGASGLDAFGDIFGADGAVDPLAVGEYIPLLIDCGVVDDDSFATSGISSDQFSCLFEHLDAEALNSFLATTDNPNAVPDLSSAASLFDAFGKCDIDLQDLIDSADSLPVDPSTGTGNGTVVSTDLLICLTGNGVSPSLAANYAAGLTDASDPALATALATCEGGGSGGGLVIPDASGGSTTIDPSVFDTLPVTAEQAQCLLDEVGPEQLDGIANGTVSPLTILGALGACNITIADLLAG